MKEFEPGVAPVGPAKADSDSFQIGKLAKQKGRPLPGALLTGFRNVPVFSYDITA